jgi:hypothetical protein
MPPPDTGHPQVTIRHFPLPSARQHRSNITRCQNNQGTDKTDANSQEQVLHHSLESHLKQAPDGFGVHRLIVLLGRRRAKLPRFRGGLLWHIRFAGPVFRFGQNPALGFCFGLEVSDMRVRTISRLYGNESTAAFIISGSKERTILAIAQYATWTVNIPVLHFAFSLASRASLSALRRLWFS